VINVLVATIDADRRPGGLQHLPEHRLLVDSRKGWADAANALLDQAAERGGDALFLDDDVTLYPSTLALLNHYYDRAAVFGFTLVSGGGVASAGLVANASGGLTPPSDIRDILAPAYVAHVTTSAIYIKADVVRAGVRFPVWPGAHHEDVAFTYDCWLRGFNVAYLPGLVEHPLTQHGAGGTKSADPAFNDKRATNAHHLSVWIQQRGVLEAIAAGRIPTKRWGL
jgi:hypothetical protein